MSSPVVRTRRRAPSHRPRVCGHGPSLPSLHDQQLICVTKMSEAATCERFMILHRLPTRNPSRLNVPPPRTAKAVPVACVLVADLSSAAKDAPPPKYPAHGVVPTGFMKGVMPLIATTSPASGASVVV